MCTTCNACSENGDHKTKMKLLISDVCFAASTYRLTISVAEI